MNDLHVPTYPAPSMPFSFDDGTMPPAVSGARPMATLDFLSQLARRSQESQKPIPWEQELLALYRQALMNMPRGPVAHPQDARMTPPYFTSSWNERPMIRDMRDYYSGRVTQEPFNFPPEIMEMIDAIGMPPQALVNMMQR